MWNRYWVVLLAFVASLSIDSLAFAQGLQSSPYAAPSLLRGDRLGLGPSSPFGGPYTIREGLTEPSSKKHVPNLQAGYIYQSGKNWRTGYFTLDYILPISVGRNSIVFGEAHSEFQGLSTKLPGESDDQTYLSFGGGYRTLLRRTTLVGFNAFYDTARFASKWLSSGGAGLEFATLLHGHDALDVNFNWYGDLANEGTLVNESRDGLDNFELQVGYSHQLFHRGPDLRLYGTGYKFDDGGGVYGWQAGLELKSPDGVLSAKCQTAYDPVNSSYQTVSAFVNVGFQLENLLKGQNPLVMPEPIFNSPRNFNRLNDKVKRHWKHTTHGVSSLNEVDHGREVRIKNNLDTKQTVYVKFLDNSGKCKQWGKNGQYTPSDFPGWTASTTDCNLLYAELNPQQSLPLSFNKPGNGDTTITISMATTTGCNVTQAEMTVHNYFSNEWHDGYDISLVNGFNYKVRIDAPYNEVRDPYTPGNPIRCLPTIQAGSQLGNSNNPGVFGLGNDQCCASCRPPADCCAEWGDKIAAEAHPTYNNAAPNCPVADPYAPCANTNPKPVHGGAQRCDARPRCQMDGWHSQATGKVFTVTFDN